MKRDTTARKFGRKFRDGRKFGRKYHRYNKHRLHINFKMAEQEGKRLIDCITKMGFFAVLAFELVRN